MKLYVSESGLDSLIWVGPSSSGSSGGELGLTFFFYFLGKGGISSLKRFVILNDFFFEPLFHDFWEDCCACSSFFRICVSFGSIFSSPALLPLGVMIFLRSSFIFRFSYDKRNSSSFIIVYSKRDWAKYTPTLCKWKCSKSLVTLAWLKYPWNDASRVKQFMMPYSLHNTTLAVLSFDFWRRNLHEKKRNISLCSDINFGITRICKYLLSWIGNSGPYMKTFFLRLCPCMSMKARI